MDTTTEGAMLIGTGVTMVGNSTNYSSFEVTYYGESVREIAEQVAEDERVNLTVRDEAGFVRGWVHGRNDWRAE